MIPYFVSFLIGGLVGLTELLSKYTWSFCNIFKNSAGWLYISVSGSGSLLAYFFIVSFGLMPSVKATGWFWHVFISSVLGVAVFRSSFANLDVGGKQFSAGVGVILDVFKKRAERNLDQDIQDSLYITVLPLVSKLSFAAAKDHLVLLSSEVLRSLSDQEKKEYLKGVDRISKLTAPDSSKMVVFSLLLINLTGEKLFKTIIDNTTKLFAEQSKNVQDELDENMRRLAEYKSSIDNYTNEHGSNS